MNIQEGPKPAKKNINNYIAETRERFEFTFTRTTIYSDYTNDTKQKKESQKSLFKLREELFSTN